MGNRNELVPPQKIPVISYKIISVLGSGSYGTVFKAWDLDDNQIYAIKKIDSDPANPTSEAEILKEITILDNLQKIDPKPVIIPNFFGYSTEKKDEKTSYLLKFELKEGTLRSLIQEKIDKKQRFAFESVRKWTISLIKGLAYLQSKGISHRDLKCENILYSYHHNLQESGIKLTITDFGESSIQVSKKDLLRTIHLRGTFANMAPELRISYFKDSPSLTYNPYKADAFSLGITLLELGTLKLPYSGNKEKNMDLTNIKSGNFEKELRNMMREMKEYYEGKSRSEEEKKIIKRLEEILGKLLDTDENHRSDFLEIFQEINKLATNEELVGSLSNEIVKETGSENIIQGFQKRNTVPSKSEDFTKETSPKPKNESVNHNKRISELPSRKSKKNEIPKDGVSEVIFPSGDRYFGQFSNSQKHGKGILTMPNGDVYKGDFESDEIEGNGEYLYQNGDKYVGEVHKAKRHGKGVLKIKNVGFYEGEWVDGFQEGHGEFRWDNCDKYKGNFIKGMINGKGICEYIDGRVYEGEWKNGKKDGQGVLTTPKGEKYVGTFKDDEFEGQGVLYLTDGKKTAGIWKKGELIEKKDDCRVF